MTRSPKVRGQSRLGEITTDRGRVVIKGSYLTRAPKVRAQSRLGEITTGRGRSTKFRRGHHRSGEVTTGQGMSPQVSAGQTWVDEVIARQQPGGKASASLIGPPAGLQEDVSRSAEVNRDLTRSPKVSVGAGIRFTLRFLCLRTTTLSKLTLLTGI